MPKLSIITINYNNATGLQKTMDSVFEQTFTDFEYLVIDGGSDDDSKELIKNHENKLVYWVSEKDKGVYHAMNKGIVKANGEYLLFLNSGDFLYSESSLSDFFDNSNGEDIVYGDVLRVSPDSQLMKSYPSQLSFSFFLQDSLHHQSIILKKSVFEKTGLYNESFKIVSDWLVSMNAICLYQASYKHVDNCVSIFPTNGISSDPVYVELFKKERNEVIDQYYSAFIKDYQMANDKAIALEECRLLLKNTINSNGYKFVKNITSSNFYRSVKRIAGSFTRL
ncbi:MAG: glycosyltransferase [Bacteroidota bacterium]|nr:glycosyltransferase [Bacteroidota bacterium]